MPRRPILALGLLLAVIPMAGCGSEDPELIPQTRASALTSTIDKISAARDDNDPAKAKAAVQAANQQVSELPRRVNAQLKENVRDPDAGANRDPDAGADGDADAGADCGTSGRRRCPCSRGPGPAMTDELFADRYKLDRR